MIKPQAIMKYVLFGALLIGMYYSAYAWLVTKDWPREDYNYCYFIPLIFFYFIWEKRKDLGAEPATASWAGLLLLIPGIFLFWIGDLAGELYSLYLSSWLVAVGILWMHIGWRKLKVLAFALLVALTMYPLPNFLNTKITFGLKLISSQFGVMLLHLYGMSAYREGNVIDLGFTQLQVVDACSGLRYLFPLFIMGILLAYFYRAALWKRLVLVFSTIPLTIAINSLRIALTGIIYVYWGAAVAEGFFHSFSGWLIFIISLIILVAEMKVLSFREKVFGKNDKERLSVKKEVLSVKWKDLTLETSNLERESSNLTLKTANLRRDSFFNPHFVVASVLLVVTLGISAAVEFREKVPSSKPFNQFPLTVGSWEGIRQFMEQDIITSLDLSDYTMIGFKNGDGKHMDFYVAWYQSQRKGESIHSPETCLPGGGWEFKQAGKAQVPLFEPGRSITVQRAMMEKSGSRQLSYFWFPARGRILTNAWEMKLYTFWDALTRRRTDGALVRLITPVAGSETLEEAEKRLQEFTKGIVPILDEFLPK